MANSNEQSEEKTAPAGSDRLFLSKLPLTATMSKLREALGEIKVSHWLADRKTGACYGSCMVQLNSVDAAKKAVETPPKIDKKKIKICI